MPETADRAAAVTIEPILTGELPNPEAYVYGSAEAFFQPAFTGLLPQTVSRCPRSARCRGGPAPQGRIRWLSPNSCHR